MAIRFRKQAIKFLQKARPEDVDRIRSQMNQLFVSVNERSVIPLNELDIKKMKGE